MTFFTWSQTAASNNTADTTINWREGQAASTVNNSARAMMAAAAKYRDDRSGKLNTGGSSTAYTISSNQVFTSLSDGITIVARVHATNGATPTLNVDGLGAKSINVATSTAVATGALLAGSVWGFTYDSADDVWYVNAPPQVITRASLGLDTTDSPQFTAINLGNASDTTLARSSAGNMTIEGNLVYRAGGTDVPITDGGTGQSTAAGAFSALKQAASDSATGVIEIAVQSEMEAASSTSLAVTPGRQHFHPAHPKAGGSLNGSGTPAFRSGDVGMGAVTDHGTGDFTLSLDTAFANTNYWLTAWARAQTATSEAIVSASPTGSKTSSSIRIECKRGNDNDQDSSEIGVAFWGDYA